MAYTRRAPRTTIIAALALAALATEVSAQQQRSYYDSRWAQPRPLDD